ncbi:MAG: hypothetical protein V1870_03375 [Candidatus Aenigmatarchaeota archaeon]
MSKLSRYVLDKKRDELDYTIRQIDKQIAILNTAKLNNVDEDSDEFKKPLQECIKLETDIFYLLLDGRSQQPYHGIYWAGAYAPFSENPNHYRFFIDSEAKTTLSRLRGGEWVFVDMLYGNDSNCDFCCLRKDDMEKLERYDDPELGKVVVMMPSILAHPAVCPGYSLEDGEKKTAIEFSKFCDSIGLKTSLIDHDFSGRRFPEQLQEASFDVSAFTCEYTKDKSAYHLSYRALKEGGLLLIHNRLIEDFPIELRDKFNPVLLGQFYNYSLLEKKRVVYYFSYEYRFSMIDVESNV